MQSVQQIRDQIESCKEELKQLRRLLRAVEAAEKAQQAHDERRKEGTTPGAP